MIREGKQARMTYAKRGKVVSPVGACTKTVQHASITHAGLKRQKQAELTEAFPKSVKELLPKSAMPRKAVPCSGTYLQLTAVDCKKAADDMTLKTLFDRRQTAYKHPNVAVGSDTHRGNFR